MPVVDADTHVDENEETWSYLLPEHERFRPLTIEPPDGWVDPTLAPKGYNRFWSIDGALRIRRNRDDVRTGTTVGTRELTDVAGRLSDMDRLGIDVQVMYPTLFLTTVSAKPDVEYALVRAYNRWLGAKSEESGWRLRWVVIPPILSMDKAVEEIEWGKEHGACGVFKRGVEAGNRSANDPYFFPLYEAAERLDMPVCVHIAAGDPAITDTLMSHLTMYNFSLSPIDAFISMVLAGLPARFPKPARGLHRDDVVLGPLRDGRAAGPARALRLDGPVRAGAGPLPRRTALPRVPDARGPAVHHEVHRRGQPRHRHRLHPRRPVRRDRGARHPAQARGHNSAGGRQDRARQPHAVLRS